MRYSTQTRGRFRSPRAVLAGMAIAVALAACDQASAGEPTELTIVAREVDGEYVYEMPETVPSGQVQIGLVNEGSELHHVQLVRLDPGITADDLARIHAESGEAGIVEVTDFVGGVAVVASGERSRADAIVDLSAGEYAVLCFVPGPDGSPHLRHGMISTLFVTEAARPEPIEADVRIDLVDYAFDAPEVLSGDAVIEVTNRAVAEHHEMIIARLQEGATAEDVYRALEAGELPPALPLGGAQGLGPARSQLVQLDLEPGEYVIWCQIPSPDGKAHVMKGMIGQITVEA